MVEVSEKLSFPALAPLTGSQTACSGAKGIEMAPPRPRNLAGSFMGWKGLCQGKVGEAIDETREDGI
jgi:hypothetical protein